MPRTQLLRGFPPHIALLHGMNPNGPTFLGIHMSPVCNFRCQKCFIGEQQTLRGLRPILNLDEIKLIMENAASLGVRGMGITGAGEPFLDHRVMNVVHIARSLGFITNIPTNASMLTSQILEVLSNSDVTLVLSLDTADPAMFATMTGTRPSLYNKVISNIRMAQDVYRGTRQDVRINGTDVSLFRIAIHMTLQGRNQDQIERVKEFVGEDTLFSVSPLAKLGFARDDECSPESTDQRVRELSEKHIVVCNDRGTGRAICGFFRYGVDMNFDGQLLLDAHAIETRTVFPNIRDFNYDVARAYAHLNASKDAFVSEWLDGFCPVRSPRLPEWIETKRRMDYEP